jgi:pyrimidine operon attenuation protein/uracil phosphoribosyltransferase
MEVATNRILDKKQVMQKIKRIAFEIYENNSEEKHLVIAGIYDKGYLFAQLLLKELKAISPLELTLVKITLDKFAPLQSEISLDCTSEFLENKTIILVDDVLNTGRTFAYSLKPFLNIEVKKIQTAVIVDRHHTVFPLSANYTGYSLATTLKEHINVILDNDEEFGVYLS